MARYDVAVVGGGPGGLTAALYAARAGLSAAVVEGRYPGGQMGNVDLIENYPGFPNGITGGELAEKVEKQAGRFGAGVLYQQVTGLAADDGGFALHTPADPVLARSVIIATGAEPQRLGVPGEAELAGHGVSYCATCDGAFFRDKRVAVVGGGNSAIQEAVFLARLAAEVTVVHRRDQLRAEQVLRDRAFANPRVSFAWNSVVDRIEGDGAVSGLLLRNVKTGEQRLHETDGVFIYVGTTPNSGWLPPEIERDARGFVVTDGRFATSIPGVYACGDVRSGSLRQVVVAASEGAQAAMAAWEWLEAGS